MSQEGNARARMIVSLEVDVVLLQFGLGSLALMMRYLSRPSSGMLVVLQLLDGIIDVDLS